MKSWRLGVWNQGVLVAALSLKALGKDLFHAVPLASGVANNPWCFLAYRFQSNLCLSSHMLFSLDVSVSPLIRTQTVMIKVHPNDPIFTWLHLPRHYNILKLKSPGLGLQCILWGTQFNPKTWVGPCFFEWKWEAARLNKISQLLGR